MQKIPYKSIKVRKGISLRVEKFRTLIARPIIKLSIGKAKGAGSFGREIFGITTKKPK